MLENDDVLRSRIAENIAYYRRQNGETQAELAEKLCYSDKSVSKWERAEAIPDILVLAKIADHYDITVEDFLRKKKVPRARTKHLLIWLLSTGLVWLTMSVLFALAEILRILPDRAWLLFIYGIPIMGIISEVFSALWWNRLCQVLSCTLILWGTGLSLVLSLRASSVSLLFIVCGILQVLLILFFVLRSATHRRP